MHQWQSLNFTSWTLLVSLEVRQCKIYYCTRVKLRFLRVYIERFTMSSQQPPTKKSKQVENKQGTVLSWVKPCTSDTEPCVVEETIRIKEQPESNCLANFPRTISQTSSLFRQSQHKRKIRDKNKRYCTQMKWSDVYQEVCFNRETEAGGGS